MNEKIYLVTKEEFPRYQHKLFIRGPFDGGLENFQMTIQFYTKDNVEVTKDNYDAYLIEINDGILTNNIDRNFIEKNNKYYPMLSWALKREILACEFAENYGDEPEQLTSTSSLDWTMTDSVKEVL